MPSLCTYWALCVFPGPREAVRLEMGANLALDSESSQLSGWAGVLIGWAFPQTHRQTDTCKHTKSSWLSSHSASAWSFSCSFWAEWLLPPLSLGTCLSSFSIFASFALGLSPLQDCVPHQHLVHYHGDNHATDPCWHQWLLNGSGGASMAGLPSVCMGIQSGFALSLPLSRSSFYDFCGFHWAHTSLPQLYSISSIIHLFLKPHGCCGQLLQSFHLDFYPVYSYGNIKVCQKQ